MSEEPLPLNGARRLIRQKGFQRAILENDPNFLRFTSPNHQPRPFPLSQLDRKAYEWFKDRCPQIYEAANLVERQHRLGWLSEGSLAYHLSKFESAPPPVVEEMALWCEFVASAPPLLRRPRKYL